MSAFLKEGPVRSAFITAHHRPPRKKKKNPNSVEAFGVKSKGNAAAFQIVRETGSGNVFPVKSSQNCVIKIRN